MVPLQVAVPFGSVGQGEQEEPQLLTLEFESQALPQAWKVALQVKPQLEPSQVAVAFAGVTQGVQALPQVLGSVSSAHALPHA